MPVLDGMVVLAELNRTGRIYRIPVFIITSADNMQLLESWSQVVGIADVFDALISPRVYKETYDRRTAVNMINEGKCGAFNPKILEVFNKVAEEIIAAHEQ